MVAATSMPRAATPDVIAMSDVRFVWPGRNAFSLAADTFALPGAKRILLIGPSGSGKSTFLSLLCAIAAPQSARNEIRGTDITSLPASARDALRAEHGRVVCRISNRPPYGPD